MTPTTGTTPVVATFLAQHRGGGLFSELVSQRAGALLALASYRLGLSPSTVTLAGLVVGVGSSVVLVRWASASAEVFVVNLWNFALGVGQRRTEQPCKAGRYAKASGTQGARRVRNWHAARGFTPSRAISSARSTALLARVPFVGICRCMA